MFRIELDIYSGRPNPSWVLDEKEGAELIDRLRAEPGLISPVDNPKLGLGYRGFIVKGLFDGGPWQRAGLPAQFRVHGGGGIDVDASTSWLLGTREVDLGEPTDRMALDGIAEQSELTPRAKPQVAPTCAIMELTSDTNFAFWNDATQPNNNCYNFAANNKNSTFAQPGRLHGYTITALSCGNVGTGVTRDNWVTTCGLGPLRNLVIALVVAPGADFHFYRLCQNGHWCHKPGGTAARNFDNNGNWITDPQTCARAPYTNFCGFYMQLVGTGTGNAVPVA